MSLNDDDRAPLLAGDMSDSTEERAPEVKVVKEKIDEDDISLFARDDGASVGESLSPSRRGTGPVDLDELDGADSDSDDDEDEDEEPAWEPDSFMQGQVSPGMFVKPRSERTAASEKTSWAAAAAPLKTPPKLQKSRKDTSPIRPKSFEGTATKTQSPRDVASPELGPDTPGSSPNTPSARDNQIQTTLSEAESVGSSVKLIAQQWESRAKHVREHSDSFDYDEKQAHSGFGDFSPAGGGEGEDAEVSWPETYEKTASHHKPPPAGTQEWKSFLGKKVQAEKTAASILEETKRRERRAQKDRTFRF